MDLGVFLPTGTRGYLVSATAPLNEPSWDLNRDVTLMAERYGFAFALSMVKFRGFGGESRYWDAALEPFTLIGALAAITRRIRLIATASSLAMPPAVVARMAATLDQVAPGRIGINLVTGWQRTEYEQMGLWPGAAHFARRYAMLDEYAAILRALWETGRCDLAGEFFTMQDCRLEPRPRHPVDLVVAGSSDKGLEFAARHCDYAFCAAPEGINRPGDCAATVQRLQAAAARTGRTVRPLLWVTVIAAETDAEAEARWDLYCRGADPVAAGNRASLAAEDLRNADPNATAQRARGAAGLPVAGCKLIGSYATVARHLDAMAAIPGLAGVMFSFDDFLIGMEQFGTRIRPLMRSAVALPA
jgi:pyrimidine oxygenase